jgi:2-polyprenyl-3-methyl-5-hydroxy-6-metoxy-1,4-benzoquinol methylase
VATDPVHQLQLYLKRAGHRIQGSSLDTTRIDELDETGLERHYDVGSRKFADLAARLEAFTGRTLESRTALDYGCGVGRIALPLAQRVEHVYGLDISPAVLRQADRNAKRMNLSNVEWLDAGRLGDFSGRYDLVISLYVLQHIPSREGERIFSMLVRGLRPGGIGAIHVTVRPARPLTGLFHWSKESVGLAHPIKLVRGLDWSYPYMLMHSYSINRLARLLADAGVTEWHARWHETGTAQHSNETVTIFFRKD